MQGRVAKAIVVDPLTWAVVVVLVGMEAAFILWFQPSLAMLAAALGLGAALGLLWPPLLLRFGDFTERLYRDSTAEQAGRAAKKLDELAADFDELDFAQGRAQLKQLGEKMTTLTEVLRRRLNSGELTFGRYLDMAEQVYLAALDNLHEAAVSLRAISTIDPDHIGSRSAELSGGGARSNEQQRELSALEDRQALFDAQRERIGRLVAQNESAMTILDKTATALAATKMGKGQASMDAESAMAELENLARRVGRYAAADH